MRLLLIGFIFLITACTNTPSNQPSPAAVAWQSVLPLSLSLTQSQFVFVLSDSIEITPTINSNRVNKFAVSPALPIGLSLDSQTGHITGVAALLQSKTRYLLTASDDQGRSAATDLFLEVKPEITTSLDPLTEITSVSGVHVDINQYLVGGKGSPRFEVLDPRFGQISLAGIYSPGTQSGEASIKITDDRGQGRAVILRFQVGKPRISVLSNNPPEGTPIDIKLELSGKSSVDTIVSYSIDPLSVMPSNLSLTPGQVTIPAGETTAQIFIPTFDNHIYKDSGAAKITLTHDQQARFSDSTQDTLDISTIIVNTNPAPQVSFELATAKLIEADLGSSFNIILDRPSTKTITVDYLFDTVLSTINPSDLIFTNATAVFLPGEVKKNIPFATYHDVNGNKVANSDRLISFKIINPINAVFGNVIRTNVTLYDPLVINISGLRTDYVLANNLIDLNWNEQQNVLVRIAEGAVITSSSTTHAAFSSGFILPGLLTEIKIENRGLIIGHGGSGGSAINPLGLNQSQYCNQQIPGQDGAPGGPALASVTPMILINYGRILGGGGGAGAGFSALTSSDTLCNSVKQNLIGGNGGDGAGERLIGGVGSNAISSISGLVSKGGNGGAAGENGSGGETPTQWLSMILTPSRGGLAGVAISDLNANSQHLINLQNYGLIKGLNP